MNPRRARASASLAVFLVLAIPLGVGPARAVAEPSLSEAFARAGAAYDVPGDVLAALAYSQTHLDGHDGQPSASGGYGIMHLVSNPVARSLERAAELTGEPAATLRKDDSANVLGGAALLRSYGDEVGLSAAARKDPAAWYPAVAAYAQASSAEVARLFADGVYEVLGRGVRAKAASGEAVVIAPRPIRPRRGDYEKVPDLQGDLGTAAADYPSAHWVPASSNSYSVANRPASSAIDRIVIHVAQGYYAGTISWFQNPNRTPNQLVSSHYVVRSSDGDVTQMVREKDIAFHVYTWNSRSVGIEHEGFVSDATWFTDAMYRSSAALTRDIADRYGIPKDRTHIVAHSEVPGNDHTDPGPYWDWNRYMQYVTGGTGPAPGKYWVDTFADAPGHATPGGARTGTLLRGTNYVYCRTWGPIVQSGSSFNHWWLKTDLDSGSPWQNQWVSAYYLSRWGNDQAKDNNGNDIPDCT
ncbi:N-acetylmuramoyl-L-alanine amidase [Nonomuraea zeae]|uniref:N-acetylmuramoyl-L-alanine amidase n=1 Tax=Nonomuraea zeae TaxID=1642303 RepID=A0A5S4FUR8_9ACTN|nr:peptidoglycan recognition family protein [Nonomuraea zeae]TMR24373.1 N-acetylmuramoyl-L-alanine amidase [Nonomuraea zeae]